LGVLARWTFGRSLMSSTWVKRPDCKGGGRYKRGVSKARCSKEETKSASRRRRGEKRKGTYPLVTLENGLENRQFRGLKDGACEDKRESVMGGRR
jgi:hypothetical protein